MNLRKLIDEAEAELLAGCRGCWNDFSIENMVPVQDGWVCLYCYRNELEGLV